MYICFQITSMLHPVKDIHVNTHPHRQLIQFYTNDCTVCKSADYVK